MDDKTLPRDLAKSLSHFLGDPLFQVAVGGNPMAVNRMLDESRSVLARARSAGLLDEPPVRQALSFREWLCTRARTPPAHYARDSMSPTQLLKVRLREDRLLYLINSPGALRGRALSTAIGSTEVAAKVVWDEYQACLRRHK